MQITDRAGIYWCLILVAAEVRVLWSAPSFLFSNAFSEGA
jgi:hypothetical protein